MASVWTNNQFLNGPTLQGHALGLKIAAGNVPSFVDLQTGGWGTTIQDPLNSSQTPTMANFATLADALAACVTRVQGDACGRLFAAAKGPEGNTPTDTLTAAEAIARYPWYQPKRVFDLLELYPVPGGKTMRAVPYMPYLQWPPSAWVIPLKFTGGGYVAGGKAMFDSEGKRWVEKVRPEYGVADRGSGRRMGGFRVAATAGVLRKDTNRCRMILLWPAM